MTTPEGLQWGYKFVGTDLCTDDHQGGRFRYRLGEWVESSNPTVHDNPCPRTPGDGLCVARTLSGAQSGGLRLGRSVMLLVGFTAADVLTEASDKVRVARLWVHPDPVDPVRAIIEPGADLRGADLQGACGVRSEYLPEGWMLNADGCVVELAVVAVTTEPTTTQGSNQ